MEAVFGVQDRLTLGQECARAGLIFFYGLIMLRLSGRRTFAQLSAFDLVLSFIVGSSLSQAMTGRVALVGTLAAVAVLVALHVLLGHMVARSERLSRLIEGMPAELARQGKLDRRLLRRNMISKNDLTAAMRKKGLAGLADIEKVESITLEPSGEIHVLKMGE
ncbi:MAG TPA: YetF domain-containing protein [Rhizomicrobium sp.]|nr:YetF domain-containing protein [Rhizomicrobium sp.]